jgi:hypothetical protein
VTLNYQGWCRRIDLNFRSRFPYLNTKLFKIDEYDYQLYVVDTVNDFPMIEDIFNSEIRYLTAPIKLVNNFPMAYKSEVERIADDKIPSQFEGYPLSSNHISIHILSIHPGVGISKIDEDHANRVIRIELSGTNTLTTVKAVESTVNALKSPYSFQVNNGGGEVLKLKISDEVFNIAPSQSKRELSCPFIERDEALWYENIDEIYNGSYKKTDLYFFDPEKTTCLVNFSKFKNANLRNHLLLYDVVFCVLPLAKGMPDFLSDQKVSRDEILYLIKQGRMKILNLQPESRLDYGFINEAFEENPSSIVSRRALSALCAIDLVEMNQSYIFSDPELEKYIFPLIQEVAKFTQKDINTISKFLLWPKQALRKSLDALNRAGPMGISRYGVNNPIIDSLPSGNREQIEFEFIVNSDQIHLAHALDATYFPFFVDDGKYSDHPYALMMGRMLNLFKNSNYQSLGQSIELEDVSPSRNPSLELISTFDINDYIPVLDFEQDISSSVVRGSMNSLFSELNRLHPGDRNGRISQYNIEVDEVLRKKNVSKYALDLGEGGLGSVIPFLSIGKKLIEKGTRKAMDKFPVIQSVSECIEEKTISERGEKRNIKILSQVNRVARLKRHFN